MNNPVVVDGENINPVLSQPLLLNEVGTAFTTSQKQYILRRLDYEGLESLDDLPKQGAYMIEKIESLLAEQAVAILREALVDYRADVNIMDRDYKLWEKLVEMAPLHGISEKLDVYINDNDVESKKNKVEKTDVAEVLSDMDESGFHGDYWNVFDWDLQVRTEAGLIEFYLPYTQVRACIDPYDEDMPCETIRVYICGIIWTCVGAVVDQFFSTRQPSITLSTSLVQVLIYPSGLLLSYILPKFKFKIWRYTFDLNPGPWLRKEQMLCTLFYSVTGGWTGYSNYNIHVQKLDTYYNDQWVTFGYQVLLTLSTNFIGFGLAGIVRKFAVYPVESMWPSLMSTIALNKALLTPEKKENINGWTISRYRWFFYCFVFFFLFQWIPNYLMPFLSTFNWMTWIKPDDLDLVNMTGFRNGLGFNPIPTFDPIVMDFPMTYVPMVRGVGQYCGYVLGALIITAIYYTNHKWTKFLPINSNLLYTNEGKSYKVLKILNEKQLFDQNKYESYGPPFFSAGMLVNYAGFFMLYPFAFIYEVLLNWRPIKKAMVQLGKGFKSIRHMLVLGYDGFNDPLSRQNAKYPEVPEWCYSCVLLIALVLGIVCVEYYPTNVLCWIIFFAIALNFIFLIPILAIYSRTGFSFGLNVIMELIVGYAVPGNANAINIAKAFGYSLDGQAENYITNQKQAHYMRLPPRGLFRTQMVGVFIGSFVQLGIMQFQLNGGIKNYCDPNNRQKFTCPTINTFFSASIQWGVIGPKKVFNGLYTVLPYMFLLGGLIAFPCFFIKKYLAKKAPRYARYFQPTIWIGSFTIWGSYNLSYYTVGLYLNILSMGYLFKKYNAWWSKYIYLLSNGVVAGNALAALIIFFALQYHPKDLTWWGSEVPYQGYEGTRAGKMNATLQAPDGYFGPRKGHFP